MRRRHRASRSPPTIACAWPTPRWARTRPGTRTRAPRVSMRTAATPRHPPARHAAPGGALGSTHGRARGDGDPARLRGLRPRRPGQRPGGGGRAGRAARGPGRRRARARRAHALPAADAGRHRVARAWRPALPARRLPGHAPGDPRPDGLARGARRDRAARPARPRPDRRPPSRGRRRAGAGARPRRRRPPPPRSRRVGGGPAKIGRPAMRRLGRLVTVEAALALAVVAVVAAMSVTPPARHSEPTWPLSFRYSLDNLVAAPDLKSQVLIGSQVAVLGLVALVASLVLPWLRLALALGGVAVVAGGLAVALPPLVSDPYPTTLHRPPTPYHPPPTAQGPAIFAAHRPGRPGARG